MCVARAKVERQNQDAPDCWTDLVVSVLSVNNCSVERVYALVDGLRENGLLDPSNLARFHSDEIVRGLKHSGYDRGEYMNNLFALRLSGLGAFISKIGVEEATAIILNKDRRVIEQTLCTIYGIGPAVIKNFLVLRDL